MKVLQIIDQLKVGGAERVIVDLSNILHENNIDVSVLCLLDKAELDAHLIDAIDVIYLKRRNKFSIKTLFRLHNYLKKFDIVHVHCRQTMRYVGLLYFIPFTKKHRVVFQDHFGRIDIDKQIDFLLYSVLKKINVYVGVSSSLVHWFTNFNFNGQVCLLSNIVRKFKIDSKKDREVGTKILMIGNFRNQKNYQYALKVLKELPKEYTLTIIGKIVDKEYYDSIIDKITLFKLTNRVKVITDIDDASKEITQYDIGLHTAKSETGPLVAIEYLVAQLPFLMFDTGEVAKTITPNLNELIAKDFKEANWCEKLLFIKENHPRIKDKIKIMVENHFSEKTYVETITTIYKNIL